MKRTLCFLTFLSLLLLCFALPTAASTAESRLYDRAGLLRVGDYDRINQALQDAIVATDGECELYVATHMLDSGVVWEDDFYIGEEFLREHGLSARDNIILLIITWDSGVYHYNLYLYGRAENRISQKEADYILDHDTVFDNIKGGRLTEGITAFAELSAKAYTGRVGASYGVIVAVSAAIALVIGIIACVCVKVKYGMKHRSVDYPLDHFAKLNLTEQNDIFKGSFVTRRVIQSSSGGGRSGGGGGGRGGGRGHAGGR